MFFYRLKQIVGVLEDVFIHSSVSSSPVWMCSILQRPVQLDRKVSLLHSCNVLELYKSCNMKNKCCNKMLSLFLSRETAYKINCSLKASLILS